MHAHTRPFFFFFFFFFSFFWLSLSLSLMAEKKKNFRTFRYETFSVVFGSTVASLAGILFAMWLRYVNPGSVMSLLMVEHTPDGHRRLGTMYGAIIGAVFLQIAQTWLPDLQNFSSPPPIWAGNEAS